MATGTKAAKGFQVSCPYCGDEDATVRMDLNRLGECSCSACDAEFSPAEAVAKLTKELAQWQKVVSWMTAAPAD